MTTFFSGGLYIINLVMYIENKYIRYQFWCLGYKQRDNCLGLAKLLSNKVLYKSILRYAEYRRRNRVRDPDNYLTTIAFIFLQGGSGRTYSQLKVCLQGRD